MQKPNLCRLVCWGAALWCVVAAPLSVRGQTAARIDEGLPDLSWPGDLFAPLDPKQNRSEIETDRIKAAALVAHGRVLQRQGKLDQALAKFQRAHRYAPHLPSILADVVALSFRLSRNETAARYAVIAAELESKDAELTTQLGRYLTEKAEFERAIGLYRQAIDLYRNDTEDPDAKGQVVLLEREIGRLHFVLQQHDQAAESFRLVTEALDNPEPYGLNQSQQKRVVGKPELTYLLIGEAFLEAGRYDDAEAMFRKVHEAKPNEAVLAYQLARVDLGRGKHAEALKQLDQYFAAKLMTGGTQPYELLEELLQKSSGEQDPQKVRRQTLDRLAALRKDDPSNAALAYRVALLHRELEELDDAAAIYERLADSDPTLDAFQGLIDIYRRQGKRDELLSALGKAVIATADLEPLDEAGQSLVEDDGMTKQLIAEALRRRKDAPDSLTVGGALGAGLVAAAAEQYGQANQLFRHAYDRADKEDKARIVTTWGIEMLMAEQHGPAAAAFRRAIGDKADPDRDGQFQFFLAGAEEMGGNTDAALAAARKATQADPDSIRFESRTAWILYHAKRYDDAEKAYLEFLKKHDAKYDDQDVRDVIRDARLVLSNICIQRDDMPQAEEWLEKILDEYPEDVGALNDLGYLWVDQNKHLNRSLKMVQAAVEAEPDNLAYRDSLGWAYYRLGQFELAVEELETAAGSDENPDGVILDHLGDAYLKSGDKAKALATWQRAVKAFQRDKEDEFLQTTRDKIKQHKAKE